MIATKTCLALLFLVLLVRDSASRPVPSTTSFEGRNTLDAGLALPENISLPRKDEWTQSNLQSKRDTATSLLARVARQERATVTVGFDSNGFTQALNSFANSIINFVTFRWN